MKNPWLTVLLAAGALGIALGMLIIGVGPVPLWGYLLTFLGGVALVGWLVAAAITWQRARV